MTKAPTKAPAAGRKKTPMTDQTAIDTTTATPVKRTLDEKIAATQALLAKYIAERDNVKAVADIQVGDDVTFNYGRPIGSKVLSGTVSAIGTDAQGAQIAAVITGEGIDVLVVKTRVEHITENRTAAERAPEASEEAPAVEDTDPLSEA